jgi:hypothetical protein
MAEGTSTPRYRITYPSGKTVERDGTEAELRDYFASNGVDPDRYKYELVSGDDVTGNAGARQQTPPQTAPAQQQQTQQEQGGSFLSQILPSKETVAEFAAPLSAATWENTKDMADEWTSLEGLGRKAARAGAVVGDVGMTLLPIGKIAAGFSRFAPKAAAAAGKAGEAVQKLATKFSNVSPEAAANAGKYARNAIESGAEAAAYDSSVKAAEDADSYAPSLLAVGGAAGVGGLLGGKADIKAAKAKKLAEQAAETEAKTAAKEAKKAESIAENARQSTEKELLKTDNQVKGAASKSAENINFAERNTGLKGHKAVHKIIEDNVKHGETVPQAVERIGGHLDEANNMFSGFMQDYGHLQLDKPINDLRRDLMNGVRAKVKLGSTESREIAFRFRKMLDDDIAELAEEKLMKRGLSYERIDQMLRPAGNLNMDRVNQVMGNRLTLAELDQIKRGMWEKTGLFRRNAMSMKNAGEKNMAAHRGGYAVMDELTELSDKEVEILEKIGGLADDGLNDLGYKYVTGIQKQGILSGKLSNVYMSLNKERSKFIGTLRILNGANDALSRHGLDHMPIYPKSEWERLAREAAEREVNAQMPVREAVQMPAPPQYDRTAKIANQFITQQGGGHGGKFISEQISPTPKRPAIEDW